MANNDKTKNYCKFSKRQDEILIESVARHPALYDASEKFYKDHVVRDKIWRDIGKVIKRSAHDCKTRWRTLRDLYNRKLKLIKDTPTGTPAHNKGAAWEYLDHMSFLKKVPNENQERGTRGSFTSISGTENPISAQADANVQETTETETQKDESEEARISCSEEENSNSTSKRSLEDTEMPERGEKKKPKNDHILEVIDSRGKVRVHLFRETSSKAPATETNPISTFFQSMAQTVMTFSPSLAIEAKERIFQIVTELEYRSIAPFQNASNFCQSTFSVNDSPPNLGARSVASDANID